MRYLTRLQSLLVPVLFVGLCWLGIYYSGKPLSVLFAGIVERLGRNLFLVISLLIPVMAGIGLNFSIVIGAMSAQMALILVVDRGGSGLEGILLAMLISLIPSVFFGYWVGRLFNRAKGREMVTGLITGFFANGIYQFIFLFLAGTVIPIASKGMLLPRGETADGTKLLMGIRNTVDLSAMQYALDDLYSTRLWGVSLPWFTFLLSVLAGLFVWYFTHTKLGQEMKAMGHNRHVAPIMGINVDKNRILALVISTVMAGFGQIIFLQNVGTINTYSSHEQVGMFAIASLLVSGATVAKASLWQAFFGTVLFHTLFLTSPLAGNTLFGDAQIGEFFRVFVAYGVIAVALALHAMTQKSTH